jgi:hypothetical protein
VGNVVDLFPKYHRPVIVPSDQSTVRLQDQGFHLITITAEISCDFPRGPERRIEITGCGPTDTPGRRYHDCYQQADCGPTGKTLTSHVIISYPTEKPLSRQNGSPAEQSHPLCGGPYPSAGKQAHPPPCSLYLNWPGLY